MDVLIDMLQPIINESINKILPIKEHFMQFDSVFPSYSILSFEQRAFKHVNLFNYKKMVQQYNFGFTGA